MTRIEIIKEMLGESHSEFVASSLKESYNDLQKELQLIENNERRSVIWDYDDEVEKQEINKMLEALDVVHSWYSGELIK